MNVPCYGVSSYQTNMQRCVVILNIIDFRNRVLDSLLCTIDNNSLIVSGLLPNANQPLPDQVKLALEIYAIDKAQQLKKIDVIVEVNEWINKKKALEMLQHMHILIEQFFAEHGAPSIPCNLILFEKNQFVSINFC